MTALSLGRSTGPGTARRSSREERESKSEQFCKKLNVISEKNREICALFDQ